LGGKAGERILVKMPDGTEVLKEGESRHAWASEIEAMRMWIKVWELAKKRDQAELGKFIRWEKDAIHFLVPPPDAKRRALRLFGRGPAKATVTGAMQMQISPNFQPRDTVMPALYFLQDRVNEKLAQHGVHAHLFQLGLRLVPESLIGCLWLQFAKAIEGNRIYRRCENCQGWFELGGETGGRSDKRFCGPPCKANAHRKKRKES
jgi:hypothetical protein